MEPITISMLMSGTDNAITNIVDATAKIDNLQFNGFSSRQAWANSTYVSPMDRLTRWALQFGMTEMANASLPSAYENNTVLSVAAGKTFDDLGDMVGKVAVMAADAAMNKIAITGNSDSITILEDQNRQRTLDMILSPEISRGPGFDIVKNFGKPSVFMSPFRLPTPTDLM